MEAHISRNCVNATFRNIRFVYNALARWNHHYYDGAEAHGNHSVPRASSVTAGTFASTGSLNLVVSMDRLLRYFLKQFIRRGAMTFTTASGAKFSCGDGTGEPVFVRFLTTDAERRVLLNPELALGEVYMEGSFVVENGSIADALAILMDQPEILPRC